MIDFNDERLGNLKGGYRVPFDPRAALAQIRDGIRADEGWKTLWNELHHQGDVGEASYAAVPFLVKFCRMRGVGGWNLYGLVACIEIERDNPRNPPIPAWLERDYRNALQSLAEMASTAILQPSDDLAPRVMLAILALHAGLRAHASFLLDYPDAEVREIDPNQQT